MSNIAIRKMKVDYLKIIDLAFKKQKWGHNYVLATCGKATASIKMRSFNFDRNAAEFTVSLSWGDNYNESDYSWVSYHLDNFTLEDFKALIDRKIVGLLTNVIRDTTKRIAQDKYKDMKVDLYNCKNEETAIKLGFGSDYNSIMAIRNESIQEDCLYEFWNRVEASANEDYEECVETYINRFPKSMPDIEQLQKEFDKSE